MTIRIGSAATRRRFLAMGAAATAFTTFGGIARPFISRANDRPIITHGLQSGDVSVDSGVVWARADRPSRMLVEVATTDSFIDIPQHRLRRRTAGKLISRPSFWSRTCQPRRTSSTACVSRTLPHRPSLANRRSAASAPRQATDARSASCGRAIQRGKAGESTSRAAACARTRPC